MSFSVVNQYQTPEPWAYAMPVRRATKSPPKGDVHVFGALVVVVFEDGRLVLHLLNASGAL
ncbi:MAG: hypothetical protein E6J90_39810 [Deltaproteobacteria bacterium]|nr:MAG: hypothetical protein E6J90_39810 [Deltaproteobacteria bacterium]TMQ13320.1 MAG: hypothetical protein E6J91_18880 [Deltaproteobacteria bacterium]